MHKLERICYLINHTIIVAALFAAAAFVLAK